MVDFDNETTVSRPAADVIKIVILERRYNLMEALERYYMNSALKDVDTTQDEAVVTARLQSLIDEIGPLLDRQLKKEEKEELQEAMNSKDFHDRLEAFRILNHALDGVKLTRIDNTRVYDMGDPEEDNKAHGFT